jgi:hypothetical protein
VTIKQNRARTGRFYGWKIFLVEGLSVGLGTAHLLLPQKGPAKLGVLAAQLGVGAVTGAFIHWAHGHPEKGFVGLGIRIGTLFGGTVAAFNLACADGCTPAQTTVAGFVGMGIGSLAGSAIDAWMLGYEAPLSELGARTNPPLVPFLSLEPGRATFGFTARF